MKKKATDSEIRAFIEAICPEAPDLYMASFDEATCLRDATNLIRQLRAHEEQAIRAEERAKVLSDVDLILVERSRYFYERVPDPSSGNRRIFHEIKLIRTAVTALAALPAASEKEK